MYKTPQLQKLERLARSIAECPESGIIVYSIVIEMKYQDFRELEVEYKNQFISPIPQSERGNLPLTGIGIKIHNIYIFAQINYDL